MQFSCNTARFSKAIGLVNRAITPNSTHPILNNILINAERGNCITLVGSDLSRQIQITLEAEVTDNGSLAIPARLSVEVVSKLKTTELQLVTIPATNQVVITADQGKYRLGYLPAVDYPNLDSSDPHQPITIPAKVLLAGFRRTLFNASRDEAKGNICGVSIQIADGKIRFAATDTHRLSVANILIDTSMTDTSIILPTRALLDLEKIWISTDHNENTDDQINIHIYNNLVTFAWDNIRLTCRSLNGPYPNVMMLIPACCSRSVLIDRQQLLDTIDLIRVMADENNTINISINNDNQQLILAAETSMAAGVDLIPADVTGDNLDISFNMTYLAESLRNITTDHIKIDLNGPLQPVTITPIGDEVDSIYLVMPVQIARR